MKMKTLLMLFLLVVSVGLMAAPEDCLRIISYNIRDGFDPRPSQTEATRTTQGNYNNFVAFMKEQQPDILCLQELCMTQGIRFTEQKLKELAAKYGHSYSVFLPIAYGLGVTSRYPIEVVEKHPQGGFAHGYLYVKICGLNVIVTHLAPQGYPRRQPEADMLASLVRDKGLKRCLVMGDFNARSPYDAEVLKGKGIKPDMKEAKYADALDKNDYSVVAKFLAVPMVDTLRLYVPAEKRMTCPAHKDLGKNGERIDYIMATPDLLPYLKAGRIWNDVPFRMNSDHAPQQLDLKLEVLGR